MQTAAVVWSREIAGTRKCRPLDGAAPAAVFAAVEAETLQPLPRQVFIPAAWSTPRIGPDLHAKVGKTLYSVPWQHIGERLDARETATVVQFFHRGTLVTTHGRKPSGKQTDLSHYPEEKIAFHMRTPIWCRAQADEVGPACRAVIDDLFTINALFRLRSAQGILRLTDKHSPQRLEAACAKAIDAGDRPTARSAGSSPPAPKPNPHRPAPATAAPPRTCTAPTPCSPTSSTCPSAAPTSPDAATTRDWPPAVPRRRTKPYPPASNRREHTMSVLDVPLHDSLRTLKLSGMLETLDARLAQAAAGELGHLDFLQVLCQDEITRRDAMSMTDGCAAPTSTKPPPGRLRLPRQPETPRRPDP